jgi:hypothetical protein
MAIISFLGTIFIFFRPQYAYIGQMTVMSAKIQAITHHKLIGDLKTTKVYRYLYLAAGGLV